MFVCAGENEQFDFAESIGIGMVDAAINLTRLCLTKRPDEVVFVGTAGSYGRIGLMEIVESATAHNIENGFFDGKTYSPVANMVTFSEDVSRETPVNSSHYITIDEASAQQYLDHGIDLENMEFYGVLKSAAALRIPARGVFIVTNYCRPDAHETFLINHAEAKERLTLYIKEHYV